MCAHTLGTPICVVVILGCLKIANYCRLIIVFFQKFPADCQNMPSHLQICCSHPRFFVHYLVLTFHLSSLHVRFCFHTRTHTVRTPSLHALCRIIIIINRDNILLKIALIKIFLHNRYLLHI